MPWVGSSLLCVVFCLMRRTPRGLAPSTTPSRKSNLGVIASHLFPRRTHALHDGCFSSHCGILTPGLLHIINQVKLTFTRRCRHALQPDRDRMMLVFLGRRGAGSYIVFLRQMHGGACRGDKSGELGGSLRMMRLLRESALSQLASGGLPKVCHLTPPRLLTPTLASESWYPSSTP